MRLTLNTLTLPVLEKILEKEKPDAVLPTVRGTNGFESRHGSTSPRPSTEIQNKTYWGPATKPLSGEKIDRYLK